MRANALDGKGTAVTPNSVDGINSGLNDARVCNDTSTAGSVAPTTSSVLVGISTLASSLFVPSASFFCCFFQ